MLSIRATVACLLHSYFVAGIAFQAPVATPVAAQIDANGWTPKPTSEPRVMDLFRRQDWMDPTFCGYYEGNSEDPMICTIGACVLNEDLSWFGCCTAGRLIAGDCYINTSCVESASVSACSEDEECALDPWVLACTDSSTPFCGTYLIDLLLETFTHFDCVTADTTVEVVVTASGEEFSISSSSSSRSRRRSSTTTPTTTPIPTNEVASTDASSTVTTSPPATPDVAQSSTSSSVTTAGAVRTAEAVIGAVGGVVGFVALYV